MPAELQRRYGGPLRVPLHPDRPTVIANFVSTLDGIVALGGDLSGGGVISGFHEPDRFVMALLRSIADVIVVGAGTLRGSRKHRWIPADVHRSSASETTAWRASMGLAPTPTTVFVTGSGELPVQHPGVADPDVPVVIATTPRGSERLSIEAVPPDVEIVAVGSGPGVTGRELVDELAARRARLILTEGGPHLLAQLLADDLVDELFLTVAPQLVGRGDRGRLGLVEGLALPPDRARWNRLVSVRRSEDHLFLRYRRQSGDDTGSS